MPAPAPPRPRPAVLLALAAGFAVAHTQSPLFYSNQNQYLQHGLAAAGYGHLGGDWLATTRDPTPAFSAGVAAAYRVAGLWPLQVAFFGILVGYFLAAWWLVAAWAAGRLLAWAVLFTAAHAAIFRVASVWLTGVDYPWFLQAGVAGQYALGPGLQPSAFAVLLVASLAAFARGRPVLAAALAGGATVFHATYLLPAALLTLGYMLHLYRAGRGRAAASVGAVSLALAGPVVAYTLLTFPPTTAATFAEAAHVLAAVRIPHHAVVARWFDPVAGLQLAWVVLGIGAARRTPLFVPLVVAAAGATALTLLQLATGDEALALLFPWRVSAVLVPVATALLAAKVAVRMPAMSWKSAVVFAAIVAGGVVVTAGGLGYRMNEAERPALDFVRDHARPGDLYLIPTRVPPVGAGRGSMSASFTPAPRPKPGSNLIPVDLQRFRLATGVPIFVDFKAVPYADAEVLEWHRRVTLAQEWYDTPDWDRAGVGDRLRAEGVTHVLMPRPSGVTAGFLEAIYADDVYTVYRVR